MHRIIPYITLCFFLLSCSGGDELQRNPYLPDLNFSMRLDLSLPEYNNLNFPGNHYTSYNYGINGVVIYNLNNDQYMAFELTDPNHIPSDCSVLSVNSPETKCNCGDGNIYSIVTGQQLSGEGGYPMKPYRVVRTGNILIVSN